MKNGFISLIRRTLQKPYQLQTSVARRWLTCVLFSSFVFLFLFIFRPFGLAALSQRIFTISLGYGLTTFAVMALLNIVVFTSLPAWFAEEHWTVGHEGLWAMINISLIGLANLFFGGFVQQFHVSLRALFIIETYTLAIGIFPVSISILLKEARLKRKYEQGSGLINTQLNTGEPSEPLRPLAASGNGLLIIPSENGGDDLGLKPGDLLYIRAADNYVEVFYLQQNQVKRKLIRNSLKNVAEKLASDTQLFRCHKSYLVNLNQVKHVSGNAQGYKLHLHQTEVLVPVSRQWNDEIKNRLAGAPA